MFKEQKEHRYDIYYKYFRRNTLDSEELAPYFQPKKHDTKRKEKLLNETAFESPLRHRRIRLPRRKINKELWMLVVLSRYHSLEEFTEPKTSITLISKRLSLPKTTVFMLLRRFHERGCQFKSLERGRTHPVIPLHIQSFLLDPNLLQEWCAYPLWRRVGQLMERFSFKISVTGLRNFYLRSKIKYRAASTVYRKAITDHQSIHAKRIAFARLIGNFLASQYPIIWVDETSFNAWSTQSKS